LGIQNIWLRAFLFSPLSPDTLRPFGACVLITLHFLYSTKAAIHCFKTHTMDTISLLLTFRLMLGMLWLFAAIGKLGNADRFSEEIQEYGILAPQKAAQWGKLLPWAELTLGLMLLFGLAIRLAAVGTCLLLSMFAFAMVSAIRQGRRIRCHCFGELGQAPVSWIAVGRNLLLAVSAAAIAVIPDDSWSLTMLWVPSLKSLRQPSLNEVLPLWFIIAGALAVVQAGYTLYQIHRVAAGRHPDETMRL
jgi:uncharacterized membrane protein YphA (DoxX/SURF4 family)